MSFLLSTLFFTPIFSSDSLLVYSSRKEYLIKKIFQQYEKKTGVSIGYITGKAGMLIQKLKEEGDQGKADILFTVDAGNLWYAAQEGLFTSISSKKLHKNIPAHLRDPNDRWFGVSIRARTLVYNTDALSSDQLHSYQDLASPRWKKRLCLSSSKKVYGQSLVAMLIKQHGRVKTKKIISGMVNNSINTLPSDSLVLKAIASGQCDVGMVNSYYYGRILKKTPSLPLGIFWPNQDSDGVHINISGMGLLENSKNKKKSVAFMEWMSEPLAQRMLADLNLEFPANPLVPPNDQIKKWGSFKMNTSFNLSQAGLLQKDAIKIMNEVGHR